MDNDARAGSAPHLDHRQEFEDALAHYHISDEGQVVLNKTPFTALVGPTSVGRNTLIAELLKTDHYYFIISDTTRPPRQNNGMWEQDGREYFFRKEEDMLKEIQAGAFLEAEVIHSQQVSGTSVREIKKAFDQGKIAITDVEILGGINLAKLKSDLTLIYLVPPSFDEWLRRIRGRTAVTNNELRNRLQGAIKGFRLALENAQYFTFIVNVEKEETAPIIDELSRTGKHSIDQDKAQALVRSIWDQTEAFLKTLE